jgi:hypothetical protein
MPDDVRNDSAAGKQPALNRVTDQMLILDLLERISPADLDPSSRPSQS